MKKLLIILSVLLTSVPAAFAGVLDWFRETVIIEKIVTVPAPPEGWFPSTPMGYLTWLILIMVFMNLMRGRKVPKPVQNKIIKIREVLSAKEEAPPPAEE
jgi:hypothetical protein